MSLRRRASGLMMRGLLITLLSAPAFPAAEPEPLPQVAQNLLARMQSAKQPRDVGEVPFVFGSFPVPVDVTGPAGPGGPNAPPKIVPPTWQGRGTVAMKGRLEGALQVVVNKQMYKVGDKLDGYEFTEITPTEITVVKQGHVFKRPAR